MNQALPKLLVAAVLVLAAAGPAARTGPAVPAAPGRVQVVATILPLAEFAKAVAGGRADVVLLLPPGADVHTWQPRVSDMRRIERADLILSVGEGLEPWLAGLIRGAGAQRAVRLEAAAGLALAASDEAAGHEKDHGHGPEDPHVWLDFGMDEAIVEAIAAALTRIDAASAPAFAAGAGALKARLRDLDAAYRTGLASCRGREFLLAGHAAFGYLARRYGLRQTAVYGASPDAVPTVRGMAAVLSRAKAAGQRTVFYEPSLGDKAARLIAADIGADCRVLYPGHNLTPEQAAAGTDFFSLMSANLESLRHGLGCR